MSDFDSLVALGWRCDTCKTVYSNGVDECPKQSCKIAKIDSGIYVISKPKQVPAIKNGSKYHYDGFIFDSKPEYKRYLTLQPLYKACLLYTSPSPRDGLLSRMPSSA